MRWVSLTVVTVCPRCTKFACGALGPPDLVVLVVVVLELTAGDILDFGGTMMVVGFGTFLNSS